MTMFIQLHALQTVPPSCINRDDTGSPKSAIFGGVKRHRVSSQAWKRAMRHEFADMLDASELGVRTLELVSQVVEKLQETHPEIDDEDALKHVKDVMAKAGFKLNEKKAKEGEEPSAPTTSYLFFLSRSEISGLAELAYQLSQGESTTKKKAREVLSGPQAFDVALFGRMLADAPEANIDAACQVLHSISTHQAVDEFDYFTAMDDLASVDNSGAGMIGTVEFVSSTLYRYASVNVDRLVSNIGDVEAATRCVEALVKAFTLSMPTGKENTFANRTRPEFVLVEVRSDQPYSLVNAFENPVVSEGNIIGESVSALATHLGQINTEYDSAADEARFMLLNKDVEHEALVTLNEYAAPVNFTELVSFAGNAVRNLEEKK
ncbi:type I-E CRISPR-associated protein Cas7/Cse4/CasC [Corynebacterium breve]|uniref:Type I-E CRISPR-associated protein Cas7/Cse4/CasC n=1 Tax=Corynebacterium breve TaxID=3049799 RepID=A0ABY8VJG0_9CORY|nr:type I-E CRISPR-associated protein Cas7/Cse4/CasC [Corynebacterium breve]WIM67715.1 type I-E CRISPR-associated protein Cas7/Cse4/CasC [Corynebacterium breve]